MSASYNLSRGAATAVTGTTTNDNTVMTGSAGNASWFDATSVLFAPGGNGGFGRYVTNNSTQSGNAGAAVTAGAIGQVVYYGGAGANGVGSTRSGGGGSSAGTGSNGNAASTTAVTGGLVVAGGSAGANGRNTAGAGNNATGVGAGGGGAWSNGTAFRLGGNGAAGQIVISYILIQTQPASVAQCGAGVATFTVGATGATSWQWQLSTDGGVNWSNITNTGIYSNATTATLSVTNPTNAQNNYKYRCLVNDCSYTNGAATLTITGIGVPLQGLGNIMFGPVATVNGTALKADATITAATCWTGCVGGNHESWRGRLFNNGPGVLCWASGDNIIGSNYLQFDLGSILPINGVATQGRGDFSQFVQTYTVEYSSDGTNWLSVPGTFTGNSDQNTVVSNLFAQAVKGRYVRIFPQSFSGHMSMRAEIISIPCESSNSISLSAELPSCANTIRWYDAATGGNLVGTGQFITVNGISATTTFYAEAYNSVTLVASTSRLAVQARVNPIATPGTFQYPNVSTQTICPGSTISCTNTISPTNGGSGTLTTVWYCGELNVGGTIGGAYGANYGNWKESTLSNSSGTTSSANLNTAAGGGAGTAFALSNYNPQSDFPGKTNFVIIRRAYSSNCGLCPVSCQDQYFFLNLTPVSATPTITGPICPGSTTVSGTGINGSTINVIRSGSTIGTATVSGGVWTATVSTVNAGDALTATQTEVGLCVSAAASYTVITPPSFANLQWPPTANICGTTTMVYGKVYRAGSTEAAGAPSEITAELGWSSSNSNPNTWTNWAPASFNTQVVNDDEFQAPLGAGLTAGTWYYTMRYNYAGCYVYGGYNTGFWNGTSNPSGVATVPASHTATLSSGVGTNSQTICKNSSITDITYTIANGGTGATITGLPTGVTGVFSGGTFTISGSPTISGTFTYSITTSGASNCPIIVTGTITVSETLDFVNLQFPSTAAVCFGSSANVYGQVFEAGLTNPAGQGSGITVHCGISPLNSNTNPNTWSSWTAVTFNAQSGNNDEYIATIGSALAAGTYYYAFRYSYNGCVAYGGYNAGGGGTWDGTSNTSGVLTINPTNTAGTASSTPTLCINTSLTAITHTTTSATGIGTPTGFPTGVNASWSSNTISITGIPSQSGTFNYSIPLTGGCGSVNATGTIIVTPVNSASAASSTPSLCNNSPLTTITHTTVGASGISNAGVSGANGLPPGVSASWSSNTISITGTPTSNGTYAYSIPLTGGCGTANATGTITVNSPTISPITGTTTLCVGSTSTLGGNTPTYQLQSFTATGASTFTPSRSGNAEVLVVAGGGAGGTGRGGGGGAGGVIYNPSVAVTAGTPVSVIVGAGGVGSATPGSGTNGGNSIFGAITAIGGGRGGSHSTNVNGNPGGSGGGAGMNFATTNSLGGAGTALQGNNGGGSAGPIDNPRSTGGGGGAGAAGATGSAGSPSNGGAGISYSISGSAVFYGGGGGGADGRASGETGYSTGGAGTGGNGGGGNGAPQAGNPTAGAANTGGGGGGGGAGGASTSIGGNGGSGIVIVRLPLFSWSSSNTSVATVHPLTGLVTAVGAGTTTITYTIFSGGCSSSVTTIVTVNAADVITATSSVAGNLCLGSSANIGVTQTGSNGTVYTLSWTMTSYTNSGLSGATSATVGTPISVTPTAVGSYLYTINAISATCNTSSSVTVNVINPSATISVLATATPSTVCFGSTTVLSATTFNPIAAPAYTAPPAITSPTADEDFGNITISQGATIILNNTSVINSLSGTIGTATGTAGSYSNFTAFGPYNLVAGQTYSFSVSSLTTGTAYYNAMAIYIDYNRNGLFTDANEAVFVEGTTVSGAHTVTGSFTVPAGVSGGLTRMRVVSNEGLVTSPTMGISFGEYEEYTINLGTTSTGLTWFNGASSIGTTNPLTTAALSTTSTFTAQATFSGCPVTSNVAIVTVNPIPLAPTFTNNTDLCGFGIPSVTFAGNNSQTVANLNWFDASTAGTNVNPSGNSGAINVSHYNNNFSSGLTSGTVTGSIAGTAGLNAGAMRITPPISTGQVGGFTVPGTGLDSDGHKISFSLATTSATDVADGMSVNFGDDVPTTSATAEQGAGSKLSICFDTYEVAGATSQGIRIKYAGVELAYSPNIAWRGATVPVVIDISNAGLVTVTVSGVALLSNVALPAAYLSANKAAWTFGFLARSGGIAGEHTIDDLLIQYASLISATTYPTSISSTTTWYVSETVSGCSSVRTPVTVTVLPAPAFSLSTTALSLCGGDASSPVTVTSGASSYDVYSWTPVTNVSGDASAGWVFSSATVTSPVITNYILNVSQSAGICVTSVPFTLTVNPKPTAVTAASSLGTICDGATVNLTSSAVGNDAISYSYTTGFETVPAGWTIATLNGNTWFQTNTPFNGARTGSGALQYTYNFSLPADSWIFTNSQPLVAGITYTLSFWERTSTYDERLRVFVGNAATVAAQTTQLANYGNHQLAAYTQRSVTFTPLTSGNYFFSIQCRSVANMGWINIDDFSITGGNTPPISYAWTANPAGFTSAVQNPTGVTPTVNTTYTVEATNSFNCKATNTVPVVVNPRPTSTITSNSTNVCYGNDFALAGNITASGAWTMTLSPSGTITGSGSGTWTSTVVPTATTTYSVTNIVDALGCPVGTLSGNTVLTLPTVTAALSPTDNATCIVKGTNWTHFYTSAGKLVVSIKANNPTDDLGVVTASAYVSPDAQVTSACADPAATTFKTAVLGRNWYINPTNNLPATIRLPITNAEVAALVAKSATTTVNPNDDVFAIGDINLSKYNGLNENGSWQDNCNPADSTSYATSNLYINQGSNGAISIANGFVETIAGSSYIEFTIPGFSEFWLMNSGNATPLPVQLTNFAATCNKEEVLVKWTTASEQNSQNFIVQRSRDLSEWEYVSTVNAAGYSNFSINYESIDTNPIGGTSYYRLVQIDYNGVEKIYGPISVSCSDASNGMIVFPNPTKGNFTVEITTDEDFSDSQLVITDLSGKVITSRIINVLEGKTQAIFENQDLQLGTYIIQLNSSNHNIQPVRVVVN